VLGPELLVLRQGHFIHRELERRRDDNLMGVLIIPIAGRIAHDKSACGEVPSSIPFELV
jgi:hypothetical protein